MRDAFGEVQSILVLGGGSDIAVATVERLAAGRCRTAVLAARRPEELTEVVARLGKAGVTTVEAVPFDALDPASHEEVIASAFERHGDIDVVLVAFGELGDQNELAVDPPAAARLVETNLAGAISACLAAASHLRAQAHGTLVVLSSVAGQRVRPDNMVYGATKAGLDGFAMALGDDLADSGARVMVVRPGFVRSKMTDGMEPAPLATTPEAVAAAIADGLAAGREVVWVPGALRWMFAVLGVLPRPLWRKVVASRR